MRIIAGLYRGRRLKSLPGRHLRPTSDRLRETLFNVLQNEVPGSVFIDCYAGSGAVGLEALSRGASEVYLIESDETAIQLIQNNLNVLGGSRAVRTERGPVHRALHQLEKKGVRAHICFLDPPYAALQEAARNLEWLSNSSLLLPQGIIILEHARKTPAPEQFGSLKRARLLEQGSSALSFYRKE